MIFYAKKQVFVYLIDRGSNLMVNFYVSHFKGRYDGLWPQGLL